MKFGWLCFSHSYHIAMIDKERKNTYRTLCDSSDNFLDYIDDPQGWMCPTNHIKVTKDLSYDNLCKECKNHYPRKTIVFELVKAKLCK